MHTNQFGPPHPVAVTAEVQNLTEVWADHAPLEFEIEYRWPTAAAVSCFGGKPRRKLDARRVQWGAPEVQS